MRARACLSTPSSARTQPFEEVSAVEQRETSCRKFLSKAAAVTTIGAIAIPLGLTQNPPTPVPPPSVCSSNVNVLSLLPSLPGSPANPTEDGDTQYLNAFINNTESSLLQEVSSASSLGQAQQVHLIGKLFIYDKTISPAENIACATCHAPYAGFTGGTNILNATTVAQPGGTPITNAVPPEPNVRFSGRKPLSYAYAAFSPILHYNATQADFYGGNFWDMRATGNRIGNPAAEQAQGPPVNPVEIGDPDPACVVWKVSQGGYSSLIDSVYGAQSFAINWPSNVATVCATPAGASQATNPYPLQLSAVDRGTANSTFDHITLAVASYEASSEVSSFSSKFDSWLAGNAQLTSQEQQGYELFNGKAHCNQCHLSGNAINSVSLEPADLAPMFTDFGTGNIGTPKNLAMPFYCETRPDQFGYIANPQGFSYLDYGVGAMLSSPTLDPDLQQWGSLAPLFNGKFLVPTLRNVDMRPRADFTKDYTHNGYFKSLKEIVHFYNTSQALPHCAQGSKGEKVTCWPAPEVPQNVTTLIGNLGLTDDEENDLVAFLQTLTDGFVTAPAAAVQKRPTVQLNDR
jgi:cytochrome c peroxidase